MNMTDRELLQQALDALKHHTVQTRTLHKKDEIIIAIRDRLKQKDDEPVARVNSEGFIVEIGDLPIEEGSLLYLHPPAKQVPISSDRIEICFPDDSEFSDDGTLIVSKQWILDFARAIEKAHGIGE